MEPADRAEEQAAGKENLRAVPRFEVDEDASLLLVEHGSNLSCRIVDLSLSGCRIRTKDRFPVGAGVRVEVAFRVRGLAFRFCGMTRWTDGRNLAGIRFQDVPTRRKEELVEAISEVEAAEAARKAAELQAAEEEAAALRAAEGQAAAAPSAEPGDLPAQPPAAIPPETTEIGAFGGQRTLFILPTGRGPQRVVTGETAQTSSDGDAVDLDPVATPDLVKTRLNEQNPAERAISKSARPAGPSLVKPSQRDRRLRSRAAVDTSAVVFLIHVASRLTGRILDLSLGGCRIRTDEFFPVGIYTRVETEFRLEGLPFRLGGVVQAIHDRHHVGIRFLDMSSRKREQVEQLIEEIEEMRTGAKGE